MVDFLCLRLCLACSFNTRKLSYVTRFILGLTCSKIQNIDCGQSQTSYLNIENDEQIYVFFENNALQSVSIIRIITMPLVVKQNEEMGCYFLTKYRFVKIKYTFDVSKIFMTHAYIDTHLAVDEKHASILRQDSFYIYRLFCIKLKLNACERSKKLEIIFCTLIIIKQLSSKNIIADEI